MKTGEPASAAVLELEWGAPKGETTQDSERQRAWLMMPPALLAHLSGPAAAAAPASWALRLGPRQTRLREGHRPRPRPRHPAHASHQSQG